MNLVIKCETKVVNKLMYSSMIVAEKEGYNF